MQNGARPFLVHGTEKKVALAHRPKSTRLTNQIESTQNVTLQTIVILVYMDQVRIQAFNVDLTLTTYALLRRDQEKMLGIMMNVTVVIRHLNILQRLTHLHQVLPAVTTNLVVPIHRILITTASVLPLIIMIEEYRKKQVLHILVGDQDMLDPNLTDTGRRLERLNKFLFSSFSTYAYLPLPICLLIFPIIFPAFYEFYASDRSFLIFFLSLSIPNGCLVFYLDFGLSAFIVWHFLSACFFLSFLHVILSKLFCAYINHTVFSSFSF